MLLSGLGFIATEPVDLSNSHFWLGANYGSLAFLVEKGRPLYCCSRLHLRGSRFPPTLSQERQTAALGSTGAREAAA